MRLVTFTHHGSTRVGVLDDGQVVDLSTAAPDLPREMCALLAAGASALDAARTAVRGGKGRHAAASIAIGPPILRPPKVLAVGLNYADHVRETGREAPKV